MEPTSDTQSVTVVRREQSIMQRWNPLRNITPQSVVRFIEDYRRGILREAAWAMECIEETDDTLKSVAPKRKKSVSRLNWDIVADDGAVESYGADLVDRQKKALKNFYNSLRVTHALDRNRKGGLKMLIRQMMDAIGKGYSAHEIAWHPQADGSLKADFTFVPLWFFENRTGELRFLAQEGAYEGQPLEPKQWLIHAGDGLMIACMVAYIYKTLPLKDWLTFAERNGMPAFVLTTNAAPESTEWEKAVGMVQTIAAEYACVISTGTTLDVKDLKSGANEQIYSALVDRMTRALSALWRGADLSTMSANDQQGASLQQGETDILQEDDVEAINETLNTQVDDVVLDWIFGPDTPHLVYFQLRAPDRQDQAALLTQLTQLSDRGVPIGQSWVQETFGIPKPKPGEPTLTAASPAMAQGASPMLMGVNAAANAATETRALEVAAMQRGLENDLAPVQSALKRIQSAQTLDEINEALVEGNKLIEQKALSMILGGQLASIHETLQAEAMVAGAMAQEKPLKAATKGASSK